ncbi:DUF402 domain-containing protein [Leptolyngbya sp. 7M]|uniref:DUF402 domain-containing protein n=1 Tax=Leptolyngbya sp. 7M TaxID=2812896 RepID=UPI001B8B2404|nr:DUF402 domain-containing protein [Leptolyngbya sp. 7M]QYO65602.1 DUF402 domain-containing protein [Leptolyngbya sp. 7M]
MTPGDIITVCARSNDGSLKKSWNCRVLNFEGNTLTLEGTFNVSLEHPRLGRIELNTKSIEHFWLDRWYSIFIFFNPDGKLRNFYCNLNLPPSLNYGSLDYIDLDIDIVVWPNGSVEVLDSEEFELNAQKFGYDEIIRSGVAMALDEILEKVRDREFPFDLIES